MKKYIINLYFFLLAFITIGQEVGNISGNVINNETGKAIPTAEIIILETKQGTVVSENGNFIINNIKSGTYTLCSHALGFVTDTLKNIKVENGLTTKVKFLMKSSNITLDEVTISATKINKTIDKIGSPVYVINRAEVERTEGRNIEEVLIRVPGVFTEDKN